MLLQPTRRIVNPVGKLFVRKREPWRRPKVVLCAGLLLLSSLSGSDLYGKRITDADRRHWAFQPLQRAEPPVVKSSQAKVSSPIDRFVLAQLQTNHLAWAPPATKEQLIRRMTLDLIGLPPTVGEIDSFVGDASPAAVEKLVDRLLSSPHYGERWGQHWLDLARFAETDGFEHDGVRPHSWRYRDYVIRSFNGDKPYDRFVREQIAGDELFPDNPDALVATSFNLLGPDMVDSADQVQRRHNTLNDMTDTAALVFLGQTIGCARCHNHKSEPFSQLDYYQLQAFFTPAKFQRELPVPTPAERAAYETALVKYNEKTQSQREQIEGMERPQRERLHAEKLGKLSEEAQLAHKTPKEKRTVEMENQIQETSELLKITDVELVKKLSAEEKARRKELQNELKQFLKPAPLPLTMALQQGGGPSAKTFLLTRGDYNNPEDEVQPAFPEILVKAAALKVAEGDKTPAVPYSRAALANWIASPENPLTARVMVNRIWQHHFGRGLVATPSELGTRTPPPTHPELLDWLAREFIGRGWSIKRMHKTILLSTTYQQTSAAPAAALERDPENKLFSRQNRLRLEGEVIRDSLLLISGQLNRKVGGPSIFPVIPADIAKGSKNWMATTNPSDQTRRSLYIFAQRNLRFPFLEVFDAPDSNLSCAMRGRSTTAPQSLTLLNSPEVKDAARAAALHLLNHASSPAGRIQHAFRLVLGRPPSAKEVALANPFMDACRGRLEDAETSAFEPGPDDRATVSAMEELCRALFNLNAFVYVD